MASFYALNDVLPFRWGPSSRAHAHAHAHVHVRARALASSATTKRRSPPQWATAVGLAVSFASMVLASPVEELPQPITHAELRLAPLDGVPQPTPTPDPLPAIDIINELLLDTRIPFRDEDGWELLHPAEHELRRRALAASATTTLQIPVSTASSTASSTDSGEETVTVTQTEDTSPKTSTKTSTASTVAPPTASASPSPLPTFFDGSLSNNFTESSCPTFINNMVRSEEFNACYPISLLLQGSTSFFQAESSLVSISRVLDHACAANVTSCAQYLATVAANLTKSENCKDDYNLGNPTVTDAYTGLVAYQVVYSATCLKDADTSVYCFGDAVTNTTQPSETYFYFLPLNSSLPGATVPTCGNCLQDTMSIYHVATANRKQPIASTYVDAATMVDTLCGSNFANSSLAAAISSSGAFSASTEGPSTWLLAATFLVMVTSWLI